jgi:hypothetical protein
MNPGMVENIGPDGIDLLHNLLEPDWTKRISAESALQSKFFNCQK